MGVTKEPTPAMQFFNHEEFGQIRAVIIDGEPWLVGRDVAIALGYAKPENALAAHVPDKFKKGTPIQGTQGGLQNMTVINEAGLYRLIFQSKLPNAEKFSDWTCEEVLPSIRKHGYYVQPQAVQESRGGFKSLGEVMERSLIEDLRKRRNLLVEECRRLSAERDAIKRELTEKSEADKQNC